MLALIRLLPAGLALLALVSVATRPITATAAAPGPHAALMTIEGPIQPTSARFLSRGMDVARDNGASLLVVQVNTPGGLLSSTRGMVAKLLASDMPVVAYVYPQGAQAASAGTFIVAAAHVAAMAPATNIGAASPVGPGGQDLPETIKSKATQDTAAFMRSIAEERKRNAEALEKTVLKAVAYSASEAVANGTVDLIAEDTRDLLSKLNGRKVNVKGREVVLDTPGLEVRPIRRNAVDRFLGVVAQPNVAFFLLALGGVLVLVEFLAPGHIAPGVAGAILLALAFVGLGNLPVNWVGVGLIAMALVLFFFEFQSPGIGFFGVAGAISFILGGFLLFGGFTPPPIPTPSFRVSLWALAAAGAVLFLFLLFLLGTVLQARRMRYPTGDETLVGQTGVATSVLGPSGTVQVASELWTAVSDSGEWIPQGEEVIVQGIDGVTLKVLRAPKAASEGGEP